MWREMHSSLEFQHTLPVKPGLRLSDVACIFWYSTLLPFVR